jgi:hypothetical protein
VPAGRRALVVATYDYADTGLSRLAAPAHDAESFASVLQDPAIAGFDVTMLVDQPHHVVGEAIADFYAAARRDDLTLLYFSGHGVKDDEGRLYLAMSNTRRGALMFTAISAAQLNDAMDASPSRRKVLILDCCYSGAFPAGRTAKADPGVHTLERFQGKGRAVLTASDSTQYAFEGDDLRGSGTSSVFTRHLVEAISSGAADLDEDGDIALDELYSYVYERVVAEIPQQRPKKQEDVDGRILIARNVHWSLPAYLQHAIESPITAQRLGALTELEHLHVAGNDVVRAAVTEQVAALAADDSRSVSAAATALLERLGRPVPAPGVATAPEPPEPSPERTGGGSARRPVPVAAAGPAPPAQPVRTPSPAAGTGWLPLLLSLVLAGGVLALVSRFLVFETTYTYLAAEFGIHWISWLVGVGLPLLVAFQVLVLRADAPFALGLAGGLVAGAALSQLELVLATGAYWRTPETSESPGPGWWATAAGAVVLGCGAVLVLRHLTSATRPGLRHDWRAFSGVLLVVVGLAVWLYALSEASPWLPVGEPALLLAAACLPVAMLDLDAPRRAFGLAAVSVLGVWEATGPVRELVRDEFHVDAGAAVAALVAIACCLAGVWLAQAGAPRSAPDGPAAATHPRR